MLRSFRLGNHRSFQGEAEILLMPSYDRQRPVVPVTAVYGANASGKSNLVDGMRFMSEAVRWSYGRWEPTQRVPRRPFRLDPASVASPSVFVVEVVLAGVRYTYGFEIDDKTVNEEWLYSYPERRRRVLFERTGDGAIRFGTTIPEQRGKTEVLGELIRPNALFLSLAGHTNIEPLLPVYQWFVKGLRFHGAEPPRLDAERVAQYLNQDPERRRGFVQLLNEADLGIRDLRIEVDEDPRWRSLIRNMENNVEQARRLAETGDQSRRAEATQLLAQAERILAGARAEPVTKPRLVFLHGVHHVEFDINDESDGTRAWLSMLPKVLDSLSTGGVLVIDEIDSSLHPRLTAYLVGLFQDPDTNPHNGQLIFTTHDTTLLGPVLGEQVLQRDQVWFVEKNDNGATKLYPLTDFRPRSSENTERRYLSGSYGAVPIISGVSRGAGGPS